MERTRPTLDALAAGIDAGFPALDDEQRRLSLAVHRTLAEGAPASVEVIAENAGVTPVAVEAALESWPGVFRDAEGSVIGFWGLALGETPHRFEVGGHTLYTWCAWDALFLPEVLDAEARVRSACPTTGGAVSLTVTPHGASSLEPATAVVSMLDASAWRGIEGNNVISTCCHHINFFATREAAREWEATQDRDDVLILTVEEAFELGRLCNRLRYGSVL